MKQNAISLLIACFTSYICYAQIPASPSTFTISTVTPTSTTISWNAVAGATSYVVQYKKSTDANYVSQNILTGTTATLIGLTALTDYVFGVQSVGAAGSSTFTPDAHFVTASGANTTKKLSNAWILNTNFTLPIVRFNVADKNANNGNPKGNVAFFNSLGAGISINWAKLTTLRDNTTNEVLNESFTNIIGLQLGVLFAASSADGTKSNIFAPTLSLTVLDIQFGVGYELGTIADTDKRTFLTVSYGIPLSKITDAGTFILKRKERNTSQQNNQQQNGEFLKSL